MPVPNRKTSTLSIRLSKAQYEALKLACIAAGGSTVSGFVRDMILERLQPARVSPGTLSGDLTALGQQLSEIDDAISLLNDRVAQVFGPNS